MAIRKSKTRTNLTIEKELKAKLQNIAKEKDISFNALIINVLKEYIREIENN